MPAIDTNPITGIADPQLASAIVGATEKAFQMCERRVRCVGVASAPIRDSGLITGVIGVHGHVSGFITANLSEKAALSSVSGLLGESFQRICPQVVDGVGEITNIVVGGVKSALAGSSWGFSHITIPSVIVGQGYTIAYATGLNFFTATFEHEDAESVMLSERLVQVSVSLLRL